MKKPFADSNLDNQACQLTRLLSAFSTAGRRVLL
jgi:hypothetical protein